MVLPFRRQGLGPTPRGAVTLGVFACSYLICVYCGEAVVMLNLMVELTRF